MGLEAVNGGIEMYYDPTNENDGYSYEDFGKKFETLVSFLKDSTMSIPQMEFAVSQPFYENCEKVFIVVKNSKCDEILLLLLVFANFILILTQCCKKKYKSASIVHVEPLEIKKNITATKLSNV